MARKRYGTRIDPPERVTATLGDAAFEGGTIAHNQDDVIFADYGIPGEKVDHALALRDAIERALAETGPHLIEAEIV